MQEYWFSSRILGFGFGLPITWQGWLALASLFSALLWVLHNNSLLKNVHQRIGVIFSKRDLIFLIEFIITLTDFSVLLADKAEGGYVGIFWINLL